MNSTKLLFIINVIKLFKYCIRSADSEFKY